MTSEQRALVESIHSGPRGQFRMARPVRHLSARAEIRRTCPAARRPSALQHQHCRRGCRNSPSWSRRSFWQAQYEWAMHEPIARKQGVKPKSIKDIRAGRAPKNGARDEMAIYDFARELFKTKRVSNRNYARRQRDPRQHRHGRAGRPARLLSTVAMTLDVFRAPVPEGIAGAVPENSGEINSGLPADWRQATRPNADWPAPCPWRHACRGRPCARAAVRGTVPSASAARSARPGRSRSP